MSKHRFTDRWLRSPALDPTVGRAEFVDGLCPGLHLRVTIQGTRTFSAMYRVNGKLVRQTIGRYLDDRGPARVGGTKHAAALGDLIARTCRTQRPGSEECARVARIALRRAGYGAFFDTPRVRIVYDSTGERTSREISSISLNSEWPDWAAYLIDPTTFVSIEAYCHLRRADRTFNLMHVVSVEPA